MRRAVVSFFASSALLVSLAHCTAGGASDDETQDNGSSWQEASTRTACVAKTGPTYALGGTVLTPTGPMNGYVVVTGEKIVAVAASKSQVPSGATIVETGGVISPGFVDLHNHVAYNFLPLWHAGKRWTNRYQWARDNGYATTVKTPYNAVKNAGHLCEAVKYGEFRAMVGGTTSIQGSVDLACTRSWVRNVEFSNFCQDTIRQDVLPVSALTTSDATTLNAQFASGATKAFLVHLAEGTDDTSRAEFETLRTLGLLKPQVVGIHSTALSPAQLHEMGQIGMKIVWSPLSNMILYGKTTDIPTALDAGITVALAPDWSPSGSANTLWELKVADRVNRERFGGKISDYQLWQMATENPAKIIAWDDRVGKIAPGYYADLVVVQGDVSHPYRAFIDAKQSDVILTTIDGVARFGAPQVLDQLGRKGTYVTVNACGQTRAVSVIESDTKIPNGTQTIDDVVNVLKTAGAGTTIDLFQCDGAPEWAFQ